MSLKAGVNLLHQPISALSVVVNTMNTHKTIGNIHASAPDLNQQLFPYAGLRMVYNSLLFETREVLQRRSHACPLARVFQHRRFVLARRFELSIQLLLVRRAQGRGCGRVEDTVRLKREGVSVEVRLTINKLENAQ